MINTNPLCIGTALISVSDKTGIVEFAKILSENKIRIISTGGTAKLLREHGIELTLVSEITGFPEMLDGRVKTLHPYIHGGILGKRDAHALEAQQHGIKWIDMIVCNLYPFAETIQGNCSLEDAVEQIDIGGPSMIRGAAKNFGWTTVLTDHEDYNKIFPHLTHGIPYEMRKAFATKAFRHTALYDSTIAQYLTDETFTEQYTLGGTCQQALRYGENPHQQAAWYSNGQNNPFDTLLQGKPLSYNNLADSSAALACLTEFTEPTCVVVKHANPCGVATAKEIDQAFQQAWDADSKSAFGGIVALNRPCTEGIAKQLSSVFVEVILAPGFTKEAQDLFTDKPNVRLLDTSDWEPKQDALHIKSILGGFLLQTPDQHELDMDNISIPTKHKPGKQQLADLLFAWKVVKHLKSNAILIAKNQQTQGVGCGQVSRIDAVDLAIHKAADNVNNAVLASDAFFPFRDSIDAIAKTGIKAIIQPGGSVRDQEVIDACNEHGIAMVLTGARCFNH